MSNLTTGNSLAQFLSSRKEQLALVMPRGMDPERVVRVVLACAQRTPALLQCDVSSVYLAVHQAVQLGLEPGGPLGHAYLIPYKQQCQFVIGYRGLLELARRSGRVRSIDARVVYEADHFDFSLGLDLTLVHRPEVKGPRGEPVLFYAVAKLDDNATQVEVMTRGEVDAIRDRDQRRVDAVARGQSPWATDYAEMGRKTVLRRLAKYLPMSVEMATAVEADGCRIVGDLASKVIETVAMPVEEEPARADRGEATEPPPAQQTGPTPAERVRQAAKARAPSTEQATRPQQTDVLV